MNPLQTYTDHYRVIDSYIKAEDGGFFVYVLAQLDRDWGDDPVEMTLVYPTLQEARDAFDDIERMSDERIR